MKKIESKKIDIISIKLIEDFRKKHLLNIKEGK
jgi:hypothetical protein